MMENVNQPRAVSTASEALFHKLVSNQVNLCDEGTMLHKLQKEKCVNPLVYGKLNTNKMQDPASLEGRGRNRDTYLFRCDAGTEISDTPDALASGALKPCHRYFNGTATPISLLSSKYEMSMGIMTVTCADGMYVNKVLQNEWNPRQYKRLDSLRPIWAYGVCPDSLQHLQAHLDLKATPDIDPPAVKAKTLLVRNADKEALVDGIHPDTIKGLSDDIDQLFGESDQNM
jgi:hypothetical protein